MRYIEPLTYLYNVLYRPRRAMAFLGKGWLAIGLAHIMTLGALVVAWMTMWLVGGFLLHVDLRGMVLGWLTGWAFTTLATALCFVALGTSCGYSFSVALTFAWTFCSFVVLPISFVLGTVYSTALAHLQTVPEVTLLLILMCGASIASLVTIILVLHKQRAASARVRWILTGAAISAVGVLWWFPSLRQTTAMLFAPAAIGMVIGLSRPLSYLCEAAVSLVLLLITRWSVPADRGLAYHPIHYDDLCLLPLPGLRRLLKQVCLADIAQGQQWLLRVSQHLGQGHAARATVERIVREEVHAHALLYSLSTSPEGTLFLAQQVDRSIRRHPLIAGYAALAAKPAPGAWPAVVVQHYQAFAQARAYPGGEGILIFLLTGAATLQADRWSTAIDALHGYTSRDGGQDPLMKVVITLQDWAMALPLAVVEREPILAQLWNELGDLKGWPAALVAAITEQLLFLRAIEHRRVSLGMSPLEQENIC